MAFAHFLFEFVQQQRAHEPALHVPRVTGIQPQAQEEIGAQPAKRFEIDFTDPAIPSQQGGIEGARSGVRTPEHDAPRCDPQLAEELGKVVLREVAESGMNVDSVEPCSGDEEVVGFRIPVQASTRETAAREAQRRIFEDFDRIVNRMRARQALGAPTQRPGFLVEIGEPRVAGHRPVIGGEPLTDALEQLLLRLLVRSVQDPGRGFGVHVFGDDRRTHEGDRAQHPEPGGRVRALVELTVEPELACGDFVCRHAGFGAHRLEEDPGSALRARCPADRRVVPPLRGSEMPIALRAADGAFDARNRSRKCRVPHRGGICSNSRARSFVSCGRGRAKGQRAVRMKKTFVSASRMKTSPFISGT